MKSLRPTRKVSYAAVATVVLFILSRFTEVDKDTEQAVNVALPLILAYIVENEDTPGGVPVKDEAVVR